MFSSLERWQTMNKQAAVGSRKDEGVGEETIFVNTYKCCWKVSVSVPLWVSLFVVCFLYLFLHLLLLVPLFEPTRPICHEILICSGVSRAQGWITNKKQCRNMIGQIHTHLIYIVSTCWYTKTVLIASIVCLSGAKSMHRIELGQLLRVTICQHLQSKSNRAS